MAIPDFQSLMLPVLQASSNGEISTSGATEQIARHLALTADDRAELLPSGKQTTFGNRIHWAKFHLSKAGLVESTRRGYFKITARGREVLASSPQRINMKYLEKFEEFRLFRGGLSSGIGGAGGSAETPLTVAEATQTPDEIMRTAHSQIDASLAQDLLDRIRTAPPAFFEKLVVNLLLQMGFGGSAEDAGRAIGRSGDDGVDGVIDQDTLGLDRIYIQAKRYAAGNNIGSGAIRDFFGSLDRHKASKGLFVTTSAFSPAARETAEFLSKRIVLVDAVQLTKLMIRHGVGCKIEETLHIRRIDEDFFE